MKKILIALLAGFFIFAGCENTMNTPTSKVEEYLGKYQKLDKETLKELDDVLKKEEAMTDEQKNDYRALLEKQYQNLSYKIKDEKVEGDTAVVDVEIEVLDYRSSINKAKEYYAEHPDEFKEEKEDDGSNDKGDNVVEKAGDALEDTAEATMDKIDDISSFIDYKIKELKGVDTTVNYDITFNLTKKDGVWKIDELSESDRQKLHGLY